MHLLGEIHPVQQLPDTVAVQPEFGTDAHQHVTVADHLAVGEEGLHQQVGRLVGQALRPRQLDQPVSVERVRRPGLPPVEGQSGFGRPGRQLLVLGCDLGRAQAVLAHQVLGDLLALDRGGLIELKGFEDHLYLVGVGEIFQRRGEFALADIAERADHIGPDFNQHVQLSTSHRQALRQRVGPHV